MGKRKYDSEKPDTSKKPKKGITVEVEENNEEPANTREDKNEQKQHDIHGFDVKHFRKELATKQGQTMVLTQFLQVCLNPDNEVDYMLEYLKCGGNSHEILRQITADGKKNLTLTTPAFHLFHLIILKVQSSLPHMIAITEEACRYFLNTFMSTVEIMISESSGPRHRKIVLKLLTSMVTLNSDLGIEVLNQAPLTPKHLQHIVEKCNYKEKDNVRTCFVHFMTSFLVEGHLPLIKALLEKQGLLGLIIPGLFHDEAEAVLMFLNILKKNVIDNALISKSLKLRTFNQHMLHNMFKIFSWKGPPEISYSNKNESRQEIVTLLSEIMLTLFTNHKLGLHFIDNALGMSDANKNPNLFKALLSLKRPWENDAESEVILQIISKCPDLHRAIINVIEQSFEPKHSPIWEKTVEFTIKLLSKLKPEDLVPKMTNLPSPLIANFVRFVTLPVPLLKSIQNSLGKDETIAFYCIKVLVKMLQTLKRYLQILETNDSSAPITDLRNRLEYFLPKHVPTPTTLVTLIEDVITSKKKSETSKDYTLPKVTDTEALISLIDLLLLYNDIHPTFFESLEGTIDMKKILDYSVTLTDDRVSVLKFKVVSLWLTLDSSAISLKNPMFKELLRIMLDVYTQEETCIDAKDTLKNFFKNTGIFETDEDEIELVLYTLRYSKWDPPSLIGDVVEYVLENIKELSEYVRSKLVNFEISDENSAKSLETLFDDLMQNRAADDNAFLENKVPSPFIVGCIQYYQSNKDKTKSLKPFLSSFVINLLHSNFSPKLTEILMGDCKLQARNYVASWTGQPIAIPDNAVVCDKTLANISKSLIENDNMTATEVFQFLNECELDEDKEIVLNEKAYKFDTDRQIDSSELLIWAKYLIFCAIRLSDINQLTQGCVKKITDYFHCIIALGRRHHKVEICRAIILNLLKNPHVLKVFKPIDLKGEDSLLATKFILQVIGDNKDIVNYLNTKHKVLNTFQQKNYNEIVKAFVKINKRKNVSCEHTLKVLEVVGLSDEDDERVFKEIFGTDASNCIRDDKEPSFVLELLRYLLDKYSKSVALELQPQILRKSVILYTNLLTNKELNANLTKLEESLALYFANKPHQANKVSDDVFKKFFEANTIRKTTSHLAYVLLKNNIKFCNTFKEQILKPEILSQRELALPLGNAVICHKGFLLQNRQLLVDFYNEYKANINKLLEKPHKAGQVYINNWKHIRKLILECMELQDCGKLYSKSHKFESVELSHLNLMQTIFLKLCTSEIVKKDHLINYFTTMLHLATMALKEMKDVMILTEIVTKIYQVVQMTKIVPSFDVSQKDDFKKITDSAIWQNICKAILKDSLKVKTIDQGAFIGPQLLCLLTNLVKLFYTDDHEDIGSLFDMVTSHSEFLNVMLSYHSSEIKSRLVEFLYTLIRMSKSVMKTPQIPVYLSAYRATRSPSDRLLLAILHHYEATGLPVNEYKPYVWGDSGANYYAVRKNRSSSLWAHPTPNQVLNLFEKDVIETTVRNFPVLQTLEYHYELPSNIDGLSSHSVRDVLDAMNADGVLKSLVTKDTEGVVQNLELRGKFSQSVDLIRSAELVSQSHERDDEGIYDPLFVLPLLSHLLAPGSSASCFRLVRAGAAALPVVALSSNCPRVRAAAYHVLHRFCMLLDTETRHKNDKLFLTDFINTLRRSLTSSTVQAGACPRLPSIPALYLARALMTITAPFDPLYKPVNNFLIAKQFVDLTVVPDFLSLFHDCDVEATERRLWILDIIKDGTRTLTDLNVVFKTMCIKMIMDFYPSVLSDRTSKEKVLGVVGALVSVPRAFEILVEGYGLISWLHAVARSMKKSDKVLAKGLLNIVRNIIYSMKINSLAKSYQMNAVKGRANDFTELKINKDVENEMLIILHDCYRNVEGLEEDDLIENLKVYNSMTKRTIKTLSKNQMLSTINGVGNVKKVAEISLLNKVVLANDNNMLKSKVLEDLKSDRLIEQLTLLVQAYVA